LLIPIMPSGETEVVLDVLSEVPFEDADESDASVVDDSGDVVEVVEFVDSMTDVCDEEEVVGDTMAVVSLCDVLEALGLELVVDAEAEPLVEDAVDAEAESLVEDAVDEGSYEIVDVRVPDPEARVEEEVDVSNEVPSIPTDTSTETAGVEAASAETSPVTATTCLRCMR